MTQPFLARMGKKMPIEASASDDDLEDHEWIAPTQVAPAHTSRSGGDAAAAAIAVPDVVDERVRCAVCSINLTSWSIQDRAVHMNACIDAMTTMHAKYECPTCGKELTDYNEQRRMAHVNMCLDQLICSNSGGIEERNIAEQPRAEATPAVASATPAQEDKEAYDCMICGVNLTEKDLTARIRHVKQCGQRFGVRPSDFAALQGKQEGQLSTTEAERAPTETSAAAMETIESRGGDDRERGGGVSANAFAVMMSASSASSSAISSTIGATWESPTPRLFICHPPRLTRFPQLLCFYVVVLCVQVVWGKRCRMLSTS